MKPPEWSQSRQMYMEWTKICQTYLERLWQMFDGTENIQIDKKEKIGGIKIILTTRIYDPMQSGAIWDNTDGQ